MIEQDLYSHLANDVEVKALVGNRIYPLLAPTGVQTPYITFQNISNVDLTSYQGENYASKVRFQIDIYSKKYAEVKAVLGAVKSSMYNFPTQVFDFTSRDLYESETGLYRQLIELNLNN